MANKVLIIEDSETDAGIMRDLLQKEDILVDIATSGEEGLKKALDMVPDLILLDLGLPGISGFDVCSRIKKEPRLSATPVVVLSVQDNLEDITKAFSLGADDYIIKLPRPEFLAKKIKFYLKMR